MSAPIATPTDERSAGAGTELAAPRFGHDVRRRLLRVLIGALAVLLVAEVGIRAVSSAIPEPLVFYDPVAQAKDAQLKQLARHGGASVVVAGPSTTLFGLDPGVLERQLSTTGSHLTVYNAGTPAGAPPIATDWLERFVLPRAHPHTVVWTLSTVDLNDGVRLPAVDTYFSSVEGRDDVWARLDRTVSKYSALFHYRRALRSPKVWGEIVRRKPGEVEQWQSRLTHEGLATVENLPLNNVAKEQLLGEVAGFRVGGANTDLVIREIRRMKAKGINVVLAEAPLPERSIVLHPHGEADLVAFQGALAHIASVTGTPLLSLPPEFRNDALYQDYAHLNADGAARYSEALGTSLEAMTRSK